MEREQKTNERGREGGKGVAGEPSGKEPEIKRGRKIGMKLNPKHTGRLYLALRVSFSSLLLLLLLLLLFLL